MDERAVAIVALWRDTVRAAAPELPVELAAPFQRHYTRFGTGLPPNFCLALTSTEAVFFKFDPRHAAHPIGVGPGQIRKQVARRPRDAVRVVDVSLGPLALGVQFEVDRPEGTLELPCRTPKFGGNPAARLMITTLGGVIPDE